MNLSWQHLHSFIEEHFVKEHFIKPHVVKKQNLGQPLEKDIPAAELVVGLSGGVDSIALLHLFLQLRDNTNINFSAVHVNHGLSQYAKQWQDTLQTLCDELDVNLIVKQVSIQAQSRTSLEQQARDARYQTIANSLTPNSILFTGHHQSDQMETFLLRLMRGSGLTGLASMREISAFPHPAGRQKQLKIARPLLAIPKQSIIEFANAHDLTWVEDDSNTDEKFDRNYVRLSILPALFKRWPLAGKSINTATELLQQDTDLLNEYVEQDYLACLDKGFARSLQTESQPESQPQKNNVLNIERLTQLSLSKQKAVVRMFTYQQLSLYPALTVLNELLTQISACDSDSNIQLKVGNSFFRTHKQYLYLISNPTLADGKKSGTGSGEKSRDLSTVELMVSNNKWSVLPENALYREIKVTVSAVGKGSAEQATTEQAITEQGATKQTTLPDNIKIKWARFDEKFQPNKNSGHKKINKYLKEIGCPTWWRDQIPLVYINGELVAVGGIGVSAAFGHNINIELR